MLPAYRTPPSPARAVICSFNREMLMMTIVISNYSVDSSSGVFSVSSVEALLSVVRE